MLSITYAERHLCWVSLLLSVTFAEFPIQALYAERQYAEWHYAYCHRAECHGAPK
jgi:hypothetical protein